MIFASTASSNEISSTQEDLTSNYPLFLENYSSVDERYAREIVELMRTTRRYQKNTRATQNLIRLQSETYFFNEFAHLVSFANNLFSNSVTIENYYEICSLDATKSNNLSPIAKNLSYGLNSFCLNEFLKLRNRKNLSSQDLNYINENMEFFFQSRHINQFVGLINSLDKSSSSYKKLSQKITNFIIANQIQPQSDLILAINNSHELTNYIQQIGSSDSKSNTYFLNTFNGLIRSSQNFAQEGNSKKSLKKFDHAVSFYSENQKFIQSSVAQRAFLILGLRLTRSSLFDEAKHILATSLPLFSGTEHEGLLFQLIWVDVLTNNYEQALQTLSQYKVIDHLNEYSTRTRYWVAHILETQHGINSSVDIYKQIIEDAPLSYYATLSIKKVGHSNQKDIDIRRFIASNEGHNDFTILSRSDYHPTFFQTMGRINVWIDLGMGHWAFNEVGHLLSEPFDNFLSYEQLSNTPEDLLKKQLIIDFAKLFNFKGEHLQTFRLVHNSIANGTFTVNEFDLELLFPKLYLEEIASTKTPINPYIFLSLIRQESAFNKRAVSSAGARGLMQLMPATARMMQRPLRASQLENPSLNIRLGVRYFTKRLKQFDGDLILTLASYNAGAHRVNRWKKEVFQTDDPLKLIETIPFRETQNYVKLIYRNMFFYDIINDHLNLSRTFEESFQVTTLQNEKS